MSEVTGTLTASMSRGLCGQDARNNMLVINSSGGGIAATLDASYYKGTGARNGNEREFIVTKILRETPDPA